MITSKILNSAISSISDRSISANFDCKILRIIELIVSAALRELEAYLICLSL